MTVSTTVEGNVAYIHTALYFWDPASESYWIGDQFTDYVQFYTYELSDDVFTWGKQGFSFYSSCPVDGQYAVGIIAYDFDNNFVANFEFINYTR